MLKSPLKLIGDFAHLTSQVAFSWNNLDYQKHKLLEPASMYNACKASVLYCRVEYIGLGCGTTRQGNWTTRTLDILRMPPPVALVLIA